MSTSCFVVPAYNALTVEGHDQVDRATLHPRPDLVKICGEGGIIHYAVDCILVGHVDVAIPSGSGELVVNGKRDYSNMDALSGSRVARCYNCG